MALKEAAKEQAFIAAICTEIPELRGINAKTLYTDNQSALALAKDPLYHSRTKHIDIQYHFIRERVQTEQINLQFAPTDDQLADALTKSVDKTKINKFTTEIGLQVASATDPDIGPTGTNTGTPDEA